jgi:hypothetical protein
MGSPVIYLLVPIGVIVGIACAGLAIVGGSMFVVGLFTRSKKLMVLGAWSVSVSCIGTIPVVFIWRIFRG